MFKWLRGLFVSDGPQHLSPEWMADHKYRSTTKGWEDAPRWRFPKEVEATMCPSSDDLFRKVA